MNPQAQYEKDILSTTAGDLKITFFGHSSLCFEFKGTIIYVDPFSKLANFEAQPKADLILITHEHMDHLDIKAIAAIRSSHTIIISNENSASQIDGGSIMKNGDELTFNGIAIQAVPAYNLIHKRPDGEYFHPKGNGNGYVLTMANQVIYIAGDTENIPEMKTLKGITCAFLPMNLPYTMTPEMTADAARSIQPRILYPYHFGETNPEKLIALLKDQPEIEVRVRKMA